tara:strand:- start:12983 stop:13306 length:324 start_codon:yes stop_codon:yes gene_type:complete
MAIKPYRENAVPSWKLVMPNMSMKVGRKMRARTKGSRKMASPAIMRAASARKPEFSGTLSLLVSMTEITAPLGIHPANHGGSHQKPGSAAQKSGCTQAADAGNQLGT